MNMRLRVKDGSIRLPPEVHLPDGTVVEVAVSEPHRELHKRAGEFWTSRTLEELAEEQGVRPLRNLSELFGTWPGEPDDGFEELIDDLRHGHMKDR